MASDIIGTSTVGKANRVTLVKDIPSLLGVDEGDYVHYRLIDGKVVIEKAT